MDWLWARKVLPMPFAKAMLAKPFSEQQLLAAMTLWNTCCERRVRT
jgi:hypothetical protein